MAVTAIITTVTVIILRGYRGNGKNDGNTGGEKLTVIIDVAVLTR